MKKQDAIAHFGSVTKLAEVLGISTASVSEWGELVPKARAYQLQVITVGILQADSQAYARKDRELPS